MIVKQDSLRCSRSNHHDEVLSAFAVIGPPQEAAAELKRRYGDVVDRVTVPMAAEMSADQVRDLLASLR